MSLFYLPTDPTTLSPFSHPHHQQAWPRFGSGFPRRQQQQSFNPFELNSLQPSLPPPHHPRSRHDHHHHQTSPQPPHSLPFDPIDAHKQRLLAEFAQSLDQLYPSTSLSPSTRGQQHQHVVAAPSYESERVRYFEAQLKKEQLRKELEAERIKLARAEEVHRRREEEEEERRAVVVVEKQRQKKLQHAYLVQQHRLQQQQQQRQLAAEEEQRRRFLEQRQPRQQSSSLGGLEQLFTLLSGSESPRLEVEQSVEQKTIDQPSFGGLDQLFAFAQALENSPVPRAGDFQREVASEKEAPQQPSRPMSPLKLPPPSSLTTLRSLQAQLHSLLASPASTSSPVILAHRLEKLVIAADGLESGGDDVVRTERKKFVREVEKVLESLEGTKATVPSSEDPLDVVASKPTSTSSNSPSEVVAPSPTPVAVEEQVVASDPSTPHSSASTTTPLNIIDDAASDTSSNISASSLVSQSKGKGRAVEDEEDEEKRFEFV